MHCVAALKRLKASRIVMEPIARKQRKPYTPYFREGLINSEIREETSQISSVLRVGWPKSSINQTFLRGTPWTSQSFTDTLRPVRYGFKRLWTDPS